VVGAASWAAVSPGNLPVTSAPMGELCASRTWSDLPQKGLPRLPPFDAGAFCMGPGSPTALPRLVN
jgi:hypothetical protein